MKYYIINYLTFLFLICTINATSKKATIEAHCYSFSMSALDLGGGDTALLTTYDGLSRMPYINDKGEVNGEIKPIKIGSNEYVVDFIGTDNSGIYTYGSLNSFIPSRDNNGNGVFDFLEKNQAVNSFVTFKATTHWDRYGDYSTDDSKFLFLRDEGNPTGKYILHEVNDVDVSHLQISGQWYTSSWEGTINYNYSNKNFSLQASQPDITGAMVNITGEADYENSQGILEINNLNLTDGVQKVYSKTIFLSRNGSTYFGEMSLVDGDLDTAWADWANWKIFVTDSNDADGDGVPDFTDPVLTIPTSKILDIGEWNWHKWPWVYNNNTQSWLYYFPSAFGKYSVFNTSDGKWYSFNSDHEVWVSE